MPAARRIVLENDRFLPVDVADLLDHCVELGVSSGLVIGLLPEEFFEPAVVRLCGLDLVCRVNHRFAEQDHAEELAHFEQRVLAVLAWDGSAGDGVLPLVFR